MYQKPGYYQNFNSPYTPDYLTQPIQSQFQPQQFQQQLPAGIPGKMVNDFNEITIRDIPTDCSPAFFIKNDLTEIQTRRWSDTGSVIPTVYRRVDTQQEPEKDPFMDIMKRFDALDERLEKLTKPTAAPKRKEAQNDE